jgi:hypothetical protein
MAAQHIEGTLSALQTKLRDTLSTSIATVNGDSPDDYALDVVAAEDIYIGVRADIVNYPSIFICPAGSQPEADLGTRVMWVHRVEVITCLAEFTEEALAMKLIRAQRAVRECLMADRIPSVSADSNAGYALRHLRDGYSPVFQDRNPEQGDFAQMCRSLFEVRQQQDI